ncbi:MULTISPECIES: LPXTG cell wall anchor domain-containing protein [unclassified Streptococcus]|uniref:LPXTG cell wall anchor domain-containing protein n=1 Tax=unclassified Streptococcus TaxID=2608887 RepID=UPI00069DBF71|nr:MULTISPECIES: LPXTG cell wall anchor domain-containing protein [unclassified Streptococcus]
METDSHEIALPAQTGDKPAVTLATQQAPGNKAALASTQEKGSVLPHTGDKVNLTWTLVGLGALILSAIFGFRRRKSKR